MLMSGPRGGKWALVLLLASLAGACSGAGSAQSSPSAGSAHNSSSASSPKTSPSAAPTETPPSEPSAPAWGVVVSRVEAGVFYTVALVGIDGTVVASAQDNSPSEVICGDGVAAVVPLPVSTSNSRVYFMDHMGVVRFLAPNGDTGRATTVPFGQTRRSMFAVSPDDQRIAVIVADFAPAGASTRLYVEDLNGGGHHVELLRESGAFSLWPFGWGGASDLVLAKVQSCTQGIGPGCCGPLEFHVIDSTTGALKALVPEHGIGSYALLIAGPPSPAGVVGEYTALPPRAEINGAGVFTWDGNPAGGGWTIKGFTPIYLSPNGRRVAMTVDNNTTFNTQGESTWHTVAGMVACGWIDDQHLLTGVTVQGPEVPGGVQHQVRVVDVISGKVVPVDAQGACAGRIPGIL
jgi:hypothetical protein